MLAEARREYVKGGEAICRLDCRWFDWVRWQATQMGAAPSNPESCCKAALGGFEPDGHCPCHSHKVEE